jgi:CubicO group peptidase (beta-lactamase class C family)
MADNTVFTRLALLFLVSSLIFFSSCHVVRYVWWNYADVHDCDKFPVIPVSKVQTSKAFIRSDAGIDLTLPDTANHPGQNKSFDAFLEEQKTVAFLVIRNDSLIYEHYFDGFSRESVLPSFSIAKSFVSALIGIAIRDGKIRSVGQPVTDFIPELTDSGFRKVTLKDLLEMRSGIRFKEEYGSPFAEMSKFYYGLDLHRYTLKLKMQSPPGETYNYQSANTQLLAIVLERATGMKLPDYLGEKIWRPMGSEYPASWSVDSKKHSEPKAFCCINARAVDFAKFGQLYLNHGLSGSDTIIPASWIDESLKITNDSRDSQGYPYAYHWRVTAGGDYFAKGILGQYIYICPAKKIVIVRFGKKSSNYVWVRFFSSLVKTL